MRSFRPFHTLVFALVAILGPYVPHINLFRSETLLPPLLVVTSITVLVWLALSWLSGDRHQSAPIVSFLTLIFFSHYFFVLGVRWIFPSRSFLDGPIASLITFVLMTTALAFWFTGKRTPSDSTFLDALSLLVLGGVLVIWAKYELTTGLSPDYAGQPKNLSRISQEKDPAPDIYYIILDGYARADILQKFYDYDNQEFLGRLEDLGFWVAEESRSNYTQTGLSLASSLNFDYLHELASDLDPDSDDRRPLFHLMRNNRVHQLLKGIGYTTVHLSTGYWPVDESKADVVIKGFWPYQGFSRYIFERTPIPSVLVWMGFLGGGHQSVLLRQLSKLTDLGAPSPVFVLAHFMCPHPPFVFGEVKGDARAARSINDGADMVGEGLLTRGEYVWNYREQVKIFSEMVLEKIEQILEDSGSPKIIILQGDHGPASLLGASAPTKDSLDERHSILNAYLFPDGETDTLYPSISPVNTFRILLNGYFGTSLPLLEDRSLYSTYVRPYDLRDSKELEKQGKKRPDLLSTVSHCPQLPSGALSSDLSPGATHPSGLSAKRPNAQRKIDDKSSVS